MQNPFLEATTVLGIPQVEALPEVPVEQLQLEMNQAIVKLMTMGMDRASINLLQMSALIQTLVDKGLITERDWFEGALRTLKEVEGQALRASILSR